ncbi:type III secretion inner membrane ring lipoprotein SctJ [Mitsuaria sp. GD03876]|uniref:type III secretion system inner membrane ring lipoprotein SctJ n=1 Tax=Mitsuaria sp. GD03876 TaxID=2975399 RepID=UPI0024475E36|nr:type III secretion inner membrane ring lipoprotein SctJ [Mitsuaria sp. GD03876]MDH0865326.1 type III secretion inner membrane ring lipoprotein SctJ [Mitsuaria sp. GD03876]
MMDTSRRTWNRSAARSLAAALALAAAIAGCSGSIDLYNGLSERDANEVTAELDRHGVDAAKVPGGKQLFAVRVPQDRFASAVAILQAAGLPRNSFSRMGDVFKKDGMISTPTEERARFLAALSQELESTLSQIDGVVLARVHPVLPERIVPGEPVLPSSCSILIKHARDWDTAAFEPRIRKLVVASIPGLAEAPDKVAVVFVPADAVAAAAVAAAPSAFGAMPAGWIIGTVAVILGIAGPAGWLVWQRRRASTSAAAAASDDPLGLDDAGLRSP